MKNNVKFITRKEVSELLHVSLMTVDAYSKKGYLKPIGIGRRVLFKYDEVVEALTPLRKN